MAAHRRIRVKGIRKEEIDTDKLAYAYWLMAKRAVEEKRARDIEDKKKRKPASSGATTIGTTSGQEHSDAGR